MLTLEKSDRQFLRDQALQDERMTVAELKWYSDIQAELQKIWIYLLMIFQSLQKQLTE